MPKRIVKRMALDPEWSFLGFVTSLSGASTLVNPDTFGLNSALASAPSFIPYFYGIALLLGGLLILEGIITLERWVQRLGLILLCVPLAFVVSVAPMVGGWTTIRFEAMSLAFLGIVVLRIFRLRALDEAEKKMHDLIHEAKGIKDEPQ